MSSGSKRFLPLAEITASTAAYQLLPFRFHPIGPDREVITSEVGDYIICPRGTARRIAEGAIDVNEPLFADLVSAFIISSDPVLPLLDILATRYRTKKSFLDCFTALHIVVVTLRCNHTCHYCQVSRQSIDKHAYDVSCEHLDLALDLIFRSPSNELTIEFQGGEPALAFDKVRYAVHGAQRRNENARKALRFVMCTNLTVVTDEILHFCRDNAILISTSLDGPAGLHDRNRPVRDGSSAELFQSGLRKARDVVGHDRVSALMTTSRLSLADPIGIVDSYRAYKFDHIFLRPIHKYGFASRLGPRFTYGSDAFLRFYKTALDYILQLNKCGERFVEDYAAIILKKILTPFPVGYVDLQSPAGLVNGVVVYNYDGGVYASDESRMLAETGDRTFRLGDITDSYETLFHGTSARAFTEHSVIESLAGCSECGFQPYCGSDPVQNHASTGDLEGYRPSSDFCAINMEIIRYLFDLIDSDKEAERIFRQWVSG